MPLVGAVLGLNADQVATDIGWQSTSVRRLEAQYLKECEPVLETLGRGGRRHQNLTLEQEQQLLAEFRVQAKRVGIPEVSQIQRAYEEVVGHDVPKGTVDLMLARQG